MIVRTPLVRAARLLALMLQLALPSLGLIADARHEADSLASRVHVESQDNECERGHPEHCALCQFLRAPVVIASGVQEAIEIATSTASAPSGLSVRGSRERLPSLPRGPPHLS